MFSYGLKSVASVQKMKIHKPIVLLFIQFLLFLFSVSTGDTTCQFNGCYADSQRRIPRPCMASPTNMAFRRNISATNTCGKPAAGFCELGPGQKCFECNANSTTKRHPPEFMVNSEFDTPYSLREVTWWQSQNWWETNTQGLSTKDNPLKVNITLSFGRSFHISGGITVRFYNERPLKMFLEKSKDFGKTWRVLQYFAFDCPKSYNMPASAAVVKNSPFNVTCTKDYSGRYPPRYGKVEYRFDSRYEPGCGYFVPDMQDFMLATNVRVRLEEPFTDGLGILFPNEETLNRYYYAISDIVITGRCNCNGHAQYCTGPRMQETCECEHNTAGNDCEICKPLFNNHPWMPANASHANECQECQCNKHGLSCAYNDTLGHGICTRCQHNTEGQHCEKCRPMYYRDSSVPIDHPNTCVACNCFPEGITNDGSCLQEATPTQEAGQCRCKNKVFGQQCDQCVPGYWGYRLDPPGECRACGCNSLGTVNNTIQCDQYTGACPCKTSVKGRYCDECKDGFYFFPITEGSDCLRCPCDLGGAFPQCDKLSGTCYCRSGVEGSQCERSKQGHFYPFLDFIKFEAEEMNGTFTALTPSQGRGVAFTGSGYATLLPGQYSHISVASILASHQYHAVIRYSISANCIFSSTSKLVLSIKTTSLNDSVEFNIMLDQLPTGSAGAWKSLDTVKLFSDEVYNFTLIYNSTDGSDNCSLLVDSLVFIPDVNLTRVYTESARNTRNQLQSCVQVRTSLSQLQSEPAYCKALLFSASTEIYNGTLACGCDRVGTVANSQCAAYGGQCPCQPGVVERTCNSCDTGFYGFSSSGCRRCQCSSAGSLSSACHVTTGECRCKENVQGHNCDSCKPNTFNLDSVNQQGCLHCFGYGRAISCTSANGFIASTITSRFFVNETAFDWTVVSRGGDPVPFANSSFNGLVITAPSSPSVVYILAPSSFLGTQFRSYGQRLHVKMQIRDTGNGQNPPAASGDVILVSGAREVALNFVPSPSPNVTSYHVILDETHVAGGLSVTPLEFQSILAKLTSLRIRATYYPFPQGSVTFKEITMETAVSGQGTPGEVTVGFVEHATCHVNYTGLSCEQCSQGFTREVNGSGPFGRCVLCSCNNRSRQCDGETGACRNCLVGTYGDRCQLCTNNVQGPECNRCKPGYWGLSENGCKACDCYTPGTAFSNSTLCDQVTGQCICNATANIGGRRCDKCTENSWNTSTGLFSCRECPPCYSSIQEEVKVLRAKSRSIQVHLSTLMNHPAMLHNQTFVERLRQLIVEVSGLTQTINAALEVQSNSTSQWLKFAVAMNDLSGRLNETIATSVNHTLHYTAIVEANRRETEATLTQILDVITEASRLLGTPMRLELEQAEVLSSSLARVAGQLVDLMYSIMQEENRTLLANETIHSRLKYVVETANIAAERVRNATDMQAYVAAMLSPLYENASAVHVLGEQAVAMVSDKLIRANRAYNDSLEMLNEASQANPDRSTALQDLTRESAAARNLASQYRNQASRLYQSSSAVIVQVNAAFERSGVLGDEVRAVFTNGTQVLQDSQSALTGARNAVTRANRVYEHAQRMLYVARNFETESRRAQASANESLKSVSWIQNATHRIIKELSAVNDSSAGTLFKATEALRLGGVVQNLSVSEQQVVERAQRLASRLKNETSSENVVINDTVENFIAREIEPVQKLCKNLSSMAANVTNDSVALLKRAAHANTTAQRLSVLIRRLLNESSDLRQVSVENLSTLRGEVSSARQQFDGLQLRPQLVELRRGLQLQKEKLALYKARIHQLRSDIDEKKNLLKTLPSVSPCG